MMILGFLALFLAFLLPGHYPPWTSFEQELLAGVGLLLLGGTLFKAREPRLPLLAAFALAVAVVPLLQAATGLLHFRGDGVLATLYLLAFAMAMVVGAELARSRPDDFLQGLAAVLVFGAIANIGLGLCQWLLIDDGLGVLLMSLKPGERAYGNIAQPNHLATLAVMALVCTLWLREKKKLGGATVGLVVVYLALGIAITQSRAAVAELVAILLWFGVMKHRGALRSGLGPVAATLALVLVLAFFWTGISDFLSLPLDASHLQAKLSNGRIEIWKMLVDAASRRPWLGYGWNEVAVAQYAVTLEHPGVGVLFEDGHNLALNLFIWNGVPLGLLILGALAWWFWRHARACATPEAVHVMALIGVAFGHDMIEYPLAYAYFLIPVALLMGWMEASVDIGRRPIRLSRWAVMPVALGTAALFMAVSNEYLQLANSYRQMRFDSARINGGRAYVTPDVRLLTNLQQFQGVARTEAKRDMPPEKLAALQRVVERYPFPPLLFRYALANGLNHQPQLAADALQRLCKLSDVERCDEGRAVWSDIGQVDYPELKSIPFPSAAPAAKGP